MAKPSRRTGSISSSAVNGKPIHKSPIQKSFLWELLHVRGHLTDFNSSNLLYPKEDRVNNRLMFTCRTCHVGEPASSHCVYQNHLHSQVGDTAGVTQDVTSDPTVCPGLCTLCGDIIACSLCGPPPGEDLLEDAPPVGDSLDPLKSSPGRLP